MTRGALLLAAGGRRGVAFSGKLEGLELVDCFLEGVFYSAFVHLEVIEYPCVLKVMYDDAAEDEFSVGEAGLGWRFEAFSAFEEF